MRNRLAMVMILLLPIFYSFALVANEGEDGIYGNKGMQSETDEQQAENGETVKETGSVVVNTSLNIRTGPWGKIIGSFYRNNKVQIIAREGDWYKILYNGRIAYVHANYVATASSPAGQTPVRYPQSKSNNESSSDTSYDSETAEVTTGEGRFGASPSEPPPTSISSPFGMRFHPIQKVWKMHNGIDLPMPNGTRLNALGDGVVTAVGYDSGGGNFIKVRYDNGLESFYCHLKSTSAKEGDRVNMGQEIARSNNTGGSTGPHLHLGIKKDGNYIDPKSVSNLPLP